ARDEQPHLRRVRADPGDRDDQRGADDVPPHLRAIDGAGESLVDHHLDHDGYHRAADRTQRGEQQRDPDSLTQRGGQRDSAAQDLPCAHSRLSGAGTHDSTRTPSASRAWSYASTRSRYARLRADSSSWRPRSTMRPSDKNTTSSARPIVALRYATTSTVGVSTPDVVAASEPRMRCSTSGSTALVASSMTSSRGRRTRARASATR